MKKNEGRNYSSLPEATPVYLFVFNEHIKFKEYKNNTKNVSQTYKLIFVPL